MKKSFILLLALCFGGLSGTPFFHQKEACEFSGQKRGLAVPGLRELAWQKGMTFALSFNTKEFPNQSKADRDLDAYFYRPKEFVIARRGTRLGICFHQNGKWGSWYNTPALPEIRSGRPQHLAVTLRHHHLVDQGEKWHVVNFYLNGKLAAEHKIPGDIPPTKSSVLEIGSADSFGLPWRFSGTLQNIVFFNKFLSEAEIRQLVLETPEVKPAFKVLKKLTRTQKEIIRNNSPEIESALTHAALRGIRDADLKKLKKYLKIIRSRESFLVLSSFPGTVGALSWFDTRTRRELLVPETPFFILRLKNKNKVVALDNNSPRWESKIRFSSKGGTITYEEKQLKLRADLWLNFEKERLSARLTIENNGPYQLLQTVFPAAAFQVGTPAKATVLTPEGSGVARPWAKAAAKKFDNIYPRGTCAMPLGAFYEPDGGMMLALMDEKAATKRMLVTSGGNSWQMSFTHQMPPGKKFTVPGTAVWQLFRGDWYDAGMIYRSLLKEYNIRWWNKNITTPRWARENTFRLHISNLQFSHIPELLALQKYLGVPYLLDLRQWQECVTTSLSPHCRVKPQLAEAISRLHRQNIRTAGYCDPRLWPLKDLRGEDVFYTAAGLPGMVISGGKTAIEKFGGIPYGVICPASAVYQKYAPLLVRRMLAQGFDAVYCDQIGAARGITCEAQNHDHQPGSPENWNVRGQFPAYEKVRRSPEFARQGMMFTEDNAETCVNLFDGLLPWRWVFRDQVPLFPLVYAGKTQFFGGISGGTPEAGCAILATQLINAEQFSQAGITSPLLADLRAFLRQMIYLRLALLDFFNEGLMQRTPPLREPEKKIENFWAYHYDRIVPTPAVAAAAWQWKNCTAYIFINHTLQSRTNSLALKRNIPVKCFTSDGKTYSTMANAAFTLPPRQCLLMLAGKVPAALEKHVKEQFKKMAAVPPDPFIPDMTALPGKKIFSAGQKHTGADAPKVWNGIINQQTKAVTYISRTCVYAGTVSFTGKEKSLKVQLAAPVDSGVGRIEVRIGSPAAGTKIAEIKMDKSFRTKAWNHFDHLETPLLKSVEGKHRLFFNFFGDQLCNFGSWQFLTGDKQ